MPKILMEIPMDEFSIAGIQADPQAACQRLYAIAKMEIEDALTDPEAYVPEVDCTYDQDFIIGALTPELLKAAAIGWNSEIRRGVLAAIDQFMDDVKQEGGPQADFTLSTAATYALKKAALAADNCFHDFGERIVNLPNEQGYTFLRPLIQKNNLAQILAEPERYAIIPIWVK